MNVTVAIRETSRALPQFARAAPEIMARALNRTLEEAQAEERRVVQQRFVDRQRRGFLTRLVKIARSDRATASHLVARIRIVGPEGSEHKGALLARHEEGGVQRRGVGYSADPVARIGSLWAIPTTAIRPQFSDRVSRQYYLPALHLQPARYEGTTRSGKRSGHVNLHRTSTGALQLKGARRTFVLFGANGGAPIGVFQRRGGRRGRSLGRRRTLTERGGQLGFQPRDDIRMLWAFHPTITLQPRLAFYPTVTRVTRDRLAVNYQGFLTVALRAHVSRLGARIAKVS